MWEIIVDSFSVRSIGSVTAAIVSVAVLMVVLSSWMGFEDVVPPQSEETVPGTGSGNRENGLQSTDLGKRASPPLVFIPGIKGSTLIQPNGGRAWLTWWQAFGLGSSKLKLPLRWDRDEQRRDELVAESPLYTVAKQDIHASFLDWAATSVLAFHPFAYDWRRDNLETVDTFVTFLNRVSQQHGGAQVQVVAYSMGGLIAFAALNRRPDLFHSVLFVGVPFGHTVSFLEDLHAGTATGFNWRILKPEVLFTFPSAYSLVSGGDRESGLTEEDGTPVQHDWYSVGDWERAGLGLFGRTAVTQDERTHLQNALRRSREFRGLLGVSLEMPFHYPPIAVLASNAHPTISKVSRKSHGWDFNSAPREQGDGRILFAQAVPPDGVPYTLYRTDRAHGALLRDVRQVDEILAQLSKDARDRETL